MGQDLGASTEPLIEISGGALIDRFLDRDLEASTEPLIEISGGVDVRARDVRDGLVASTEPLIEISGGSMAPAILFIIESLQRSR